MRHRHAHHDHEAGPGRSRLVLLVLLCVAQLMVILDISAVNVALPDMADDLGIGGGDIGWTITSYSLIFGSLLLLGGRAADLLGRRRMFLSGLGVFVTSSLAAARAFQLGVDAACVYVNASTRFTDGGEFGMGAEIGNSTQKLHARGPIGLRELCTYKYLVEGDGHVR